MYRSKEQKTYATLIERAIARPGAPLLAGAAAGLGKTHGYSLPLLRSGKRVAIAFSTRALIAQYLGSDALAAAMAAAPGTTVAELKSRRDFDSAKDYREHRDQALAAQVLLVTHAAALIDARMSDYAQLRERDVVLFDEADLLADAADLRSTFEISADVLKDCGAGDDLRAAAETVKRKAADAEDRAAASAIVYALDTPRWYRVVGWSDDGALLLKHRMPGRMLRPLLFEVPRVIFTSGTLQVGGRFDHFVRALGLLQIDPASTHIDPAQHGQLEVVMVDAELSAEEQATRIAQAARPALVLTTSHATTRKLAALLPGSVARAEGEALADVLARCPADGIMVAAGAWSGLDDPRLRWATVVLPTAPYGPPATISGQQVSHYIDSEVCAIRRTNQGLHRGLRTPDARCTLLLLDERFNRPALRQAIPERFRAAVVLGAQEGQKHQMTQRERSIRPKALKHYGSRCMHPGCTETAEHRLDAHHKKPISDGERFTLMEDVAILCKHHHADVHHE